MALDPEVVGEVEEAEAEVEEAVELVLEAALEVRVTPWAREKHRRVSPTRMLG